MKTIALAAALAVSAALAGPAIAEGMDTVPKDQAAGMSGERMSQSEIRQVQQALKDAGQDVEVDGVWGAETAQALSNYQEENGLTGSGELDSQTMARLGVERDAGAAPQQAQRPNGATGDTAPAPGNLPEPAPEVDGGSTDAEGSNEQ